MRILVTGASGLLGINFCYQQAKNNQILGLYSTNKIYSTKFQTLQADLTNNNKLHKIIEDFKPELIVHCAAMANLEDCKNNPELAYQINATIPGEIAKITAKLKCKLISISTDAIFDGKTGNYNEEDIPSPLSVYAKTKLAGEKLVQEFNPAAIIPRVNFYGWSISGRRSLSEFFVINLKENKPIDGFDDVNFSPLYVNQLTKILMEMANNQLSGIYHVLNNEKITKYEFGVKIAEKFGFDANLISPISVTNSNLTAPRSKNLTFNTKKLLDNIASSIPSIDDGINSFYEDYQNHHSDKIKAMQHQGIPNGGNYGN